MLGQNMTFWVLKRPFLDTEFKNVVIVQKKFLKGKISQYKPFIGLNWINF